MLSYEKNFAPRADGRYVCSMAALMAKMRDTTPDLAFRDGMTPEEFEDWKKAVRVRLRELLHMPEATEQPEPVMLESHQRDGYRVEKWEFYPDDYSAVPFLALIPDGASAEHPVPAVMCFLGSNHNKEFVSGEPMLDHPNCQVDKYPERNRMGQYYAQIGMAAFVFDNPAIGETSVWGDPSFGENQYASRVHYCAGLLRMGYNYTGISVLQKLQFMKHLRKLPYVDQNRLAVSAHSLGTETAIDLALLCEGEIKAVVFNDALTREKRRYAAVTEEAEDRMTQDTGNWHIIPGRFASFELPDACAAFAPGYIAFTEGGGDDPIGTVRKAYALAGKEENMFVSYYPAYRDPSTRNKPGVMPDRGITEDEYFDYHYIVAPDHSFRRDPAMEFIRRCFLEKD